MRTIGEVAVASGVPAKTIRYYESVGLLPAPERADNGYRLYDAEAVRTLRFVKNARDLGFSLDDVAELLALWHDPQRASGDVRVVAQRHLADVQRRIEELQRLQAALVEVMEHCHGDEHPDCPILQDLEDR
jgi:MerR family copper efflux transcriptional regulator